MRILLLVIATFAVGLLAGTLISSDGASRHSAASTRTDGPGTTTMAPPPTTTDGGSAGGDRPSGDADVSGLTGDARTELDRIINSDRAIAVMSGEGKISGTVRDAAGDPVVGVIISAGHEAQPFRLSMVARRMRERPHEDRDLTAVARDAIEGELWRRHIRSTATTDAAGRFVLTDLMDTRHTVVAHHDRYDVRPAGQARVVPDAIVDFVARPVVPVKVEVQNPDGELAEYAWLKWKGPHGNGWGAWTKDEGTVRMPVGQCKVSAQTSVPTPLQSPEVEWTVAAEPSAAVLSLQLSGRRVLTARLKLPEGFVVPQAVQYHIRPLKDGEKIDPGKILQKVAHLRATGASPERTSWVDLAPGRYFVAALLNKRRVIAHAVGEVSTGPIEVILEVEAPDGATVKLLGPDGGPVPGPASFHVFTGPEGRARYQPVDALQGSNGAWMLWLDRLDRPDRGSGGKATLRAATRDYGSALHGIQLASPGTITIRLSLPSTLKLEVTGVTQRDGVTLYAALRGDQTTAAYARVNPDGSCLFQGVQPGPYGLMLVCARGKQTWVVSRERVRLSSGDEQRSVAMPTLHSLRLRLPEGFRGRGVRLVSKDAGLGEFKRDVTRKGRFVTFDALASGSYEVVYGKKRMAVRVPGPPEVVLE